MTTLFSITVCNGFRQGTGPRVGLAALHDELCRRYHDRRVSQILPRTWKSNHAETAETIDFRDPRKVIFIGYSYGCGWGLPQLARELARFNRHVDLAFLVDPVPRYLVIKPMSLTRWGAMHVPCTVREVYSWRQVNATPYGRQVLADCPHDTIVHQQTILGTRENLGRYGTGKYGGGKHVVDATITHRNIDNHRLIHQDVLQLIDSFLATD